MTAKTRAALQAQFQGTDPNVHNADLVDSAYFPNDDPTFDAVTAGAVSANTLVTAGSVHVGGSMVVMPALGTADPGVAGALWNNGGTLVVSGG